MEEKREIRFLIDSSLYEKLREKAKETNVPVASYIKANIENWAKEVFNNDRRTNK